MKKVIVTGSAGFLGRYISRELCAQGWNVTGVDRLLIDQGELKKSSIGTQHRVDLTSADVGSLLKAVDPEIIVHAAGLSSVRLSIDDPQKTYHEEVDAFLNVLDSIRRHAPRCCILYLSSAAVYGNQKVLPIVEDAPLSPISPYGFHKLACENLIKEFDAVYGTRGCAVRIFSAYGPGLCRQVLWDMCEMVLKKSSIDLAGDGLETRDFVHAADVAKGIAAVIERGVFRSENYNLASGQQTSIQAVAEKLVSSFGRQVPVSYSGKPRSGDPCRWQADIGRIFALGYRPQISLSAGIKGYVEWYRSTISERWSSR